VNEHRLFETLVSVGKYTRLSRREKRVAVAGKKESSPDRARGKCWCGIRNMEKEQKNLRI